jgi:bacterioferritin (cytochrome b1)
LAQQYRSALQYSVAAASLKGLEAQSLGVKLTEFGDEELSGARQLIEKIVSFGGKPTTDIGALRFEAEAEDAIAWLLRCEDITRKQAQVDLLKRALGARPRSSAWPPFDPG